MENNTVEPTTGKFTKDAKQMEAKKCRKCGCEDAGSFYGEKRRNWLGILRWKYWCGDCFREKYRKQYGSF